MPELTVLEKVIRQAVRRLEKDNGRNEGVRALMRQFTGLNQPDARTYWDRFCTPAEPEPKQLSDLAPVEAALGVKATERNVARGGDWPFVQRGFWIPEHHWLVQGLLGAKIR
jgi:hypothetical protein